MCPRFFRSKAASSVKKSMELEAFLDSCRNDWLREKVENTFSDLMADYVIGDKVSKDKWPRARFGGSWNRGILP